MGADQIRPYQALQNRAPCSGGERRIGTRRSQGWRFARASLFCRSERYVGSNVDPIFMGLKEESYHFWRGPPPPYQSTQVYFGEWGLLQKWDDSPHFIQRWTPLTNKDELRKVRGQHHAIGILIESKYLRRYFAPHFYRERDPGKERWSCVIPVTSPLAWFPNPKLGSTLGSPLGPEEPKFLQSGNPCGKRSHGGVLSPL